MFIKPLAAIGRFLPPLTPNGPRDPFHPGSDRSTRLSGAARRSYPQDTIWQFKARKGQEPPGQPFIGRGELSVPFF